jgi:hypothetical protein
VLLVGAVAKRLVVAESAPAQVDGFGFLDHVALFIFDDHATSNLIGAIDQGGDDNFVFAHGRSMAGGLRARSLAHVCGAARAAPAG